MPRQLKFAIILPMLMACAFVVVVRWQRHLDVQVLPKREYPFASSVTSAYLGLNAPAVLFEGICKASFPIERLNQPPSSLFGIGVGQILFLTGVLALWFFVGLSLDRRNGQRISSHSGTTFWTLLSTLGLLVAATVLLGGAVFLIAHRPSGNNIGDVVQGIFWLGWSVLMAYVSGRRIFARLHRTNQSS